VGCEPTLLEQLKYMPTDEGRSRDCASDTPVATPLEITNTATKIRGTSRRTAQV